MIIRELFRRHGITTIKELSRRAGWSKTEGWDIWHGYQKVGAIRAVHLYKTCGIPIMDILEADPAPDYGVKKKTNT